MPGRGRRSEQGQGAVEYILVLSLVALIVLALSLAGLAGGSRSAIAEAVCRLFSGPEGDAACGGAQRVSGQPTWACPRSSVGGNANIGLTVAFVELGAGGGFLMEELSDGTWRVHWIEQGEAGVSAGAEAKGGIRVGSTTVGVGAEAKAELLADGRVTDSRVFRSEDDAYDYLTERLADEAVERLPHGPRQIAGLANRIFGPDGPEGEEGPGSTETGISIGGNAGGSLGVVSAGVEAAARGATRITTLPDGGRVVSVVLNADAAASAGVPVVAELGPRGARQYIVALRLDKEGQPVSMRVTAEAQGSITGGRTRTREWDKGSLQNLANSVSGSGTERTLIDYELALNTPERRGAALQFLADSPRPWEDTDDPDSLRSDAQQVFGDVGDGVTVATREYHDAEVGLGLEGKLRAAVVGLGGEGEVTLNTSQLQNAQYWDPNSGDFVPWTGCTGAKP